MGGQIFGSRVTGSIAQSGAKMITSETPHSFDHMAGGENIIGSDGF